MLYYPNSHDQATIVKLQKHLYGFPAEPLTEEEQKSIVFYESFTRDLISKAFKLGPHVDPYRYVLELERETPFLLFIPHSFLSEYVKDQDQYTRMRWRHYYGNNRAIFFLKLNY